MITVEDIGKMSSEEGRCKTRRTKWLSRMGSGEYITNKASGIDAIIVKVEASHI
ncbi:MAG: hypothetical protein QM528_04760 [Phycisphaerales bacterium]|nr:hypothetical protein [Phycisphaerales bacterium]